MLNESSNPVYRDTSDNKWYFYDETWSDSYGPYDTEEEADRKCAEYAKYLEGMNKVVKILYTNYKGKVAWRNIIPKRIEYTSTEHHPGYQWILQAFDVDKKANRSFAMLDIHQWKI